MMTALLNSRRAAILDAAIKIFGRLGFKKTSMDDLAAAAGLSKQGVYLHFASKDEIFVAATEKYLEDGLALVEEDLSRADASLFERIMAAMDSWFGRHVATFAPDAFDVIEVGNHLSPQTSDKYKAAFRTRLRKALADSPAFARADNVCTPAEVAHALFQIGLTWKEERLSRAEFMKKMKPCVRAITQLRE